MKGFTFAANVIIVIAIGIIVMLGVIALFYPTFSSGSQSVNVDSAKNAACNFLVSKRCKELTKNIQVANFDADKDGNFGETAANGDNLFLLCTNYYGISCSQIQGDVNGDCIVMYGSRDDKDLLEHRSTIPDPLPYDSIYDLKGPENPPGSGLYPPDGVIDLLDLQYMISIRGTFDSVAEAQCKKLCGCATM